MRERILAAAAMAVLSVSTAWAQTAESPEAHALIERQLDAFSRNDAAGAYAEASPQIQEMFHDADTFMSMVRNKYAPVYHHRSVDFGPATVESDTIQQEATFVDDQGKVWKALYKLSRGPDGRWVISACSLIESGASA
jgi:hypothetical protein